MCAHIRHVERCDWLGLIVISHIRTLSSSSALHLLFLLARTRCSCAVFRLTMILTWSAHKRIHLFGQWVNKLAKVSSRGRRSEKDYKYVSRYGNMCPLKQQRATSTTNWMRAMQWQIVLASKLNSNTHSRDRCRFGNKNRRSSRVWHKSPFWEQRTLSDTECACFHKPNVSENFLKIYFRE